MAPGAGAPSPVPRHMIEHMALDVVVSTVPESEIMVHKSDGVGAGVVSAVLRHMVEHKALDVVSTLSKLEIVVDESDGVGASIVSAVSRHMIEPIIWALVLCGQSQI